MKLLFQTGFFLLSPPHSLSPFFVGTQEMIPFIHSLIQIIKADSKKKENFYYDCIALHLIKNHCDKNSLQVLFNAVRFCSKE